MSSATPTPAGPSPLELWHYQRKRTEMAKGELETAQGAVRASEGRLRYEQVLLAQLALCAHLCKMCEGQKYLREWLTQDESQLVACSACQATGVDPKTSQEANADWVRPL